MVTSLSSPDRMLYRWQFDALVSWVRCGRRGGHRSGHRLGQDRSRDPRPRPMRCDAVASSSSSSLRVCSCSNGTRRCAPATLPDVRIGRLGDNGRETAETCDVLVATRHSAAAHKPIPPSAAGGLLIADECHGLGGTTLRRALLREYEERLGLTATLERSDDAVAELLLPFFGGVCYRYGFEQAIADGARAPACALCSWACRSRARNAVEYVEASIDLARLRQHLRGVRDMPLEPFGDFLAAVADLAERDGGADGRAARDYLDAFSKRRQIVAQSTGKYDLLGRLASGIKDADGAGRVHRDRASRGESRDQPARSGSSRWN